MKSCFKKWPSNAWITLCLSCGKAVPHLLQRNTLDWLRSSFTSMTKRITRTRTSTMTNSSRTTQNGTLVEKASPTSEVRTWDLVLRVVTVPLCGVLSFSGPWCPSTWRCAKTVPSSSRLTYCKNNTMLKVLVSQYKKSWKKRDRWAFENTRYKT